MLSKFAVVPGLLFIGRCCLVLLFRLGHLLGGTGCGLVFRPGTVRPHLPVFLLFPCGE